jgi:hypothetical protein
LFDSGGGCGDYFTLPSSLSSHPSNKDSIATHLCPLYSHRHPFIGQHFIAYFSVSSIKNSDQKRSADKTNSSLPRCGVFQSLDN